VSGTEMMEDTVVLPGLCCKRWHNIHQIPVFIAAACRFVLSIFFLLLAASRLVFVRTMAVVFVRIIIVVFIVVVIIIIVVVVIIIIIVVVVSEVEWVVVLVFVVMVMISQEGGSADLEISFSTILFVG
jgi:hypothetical protein